MPQTFPQYFTYDVVGGGGGGGGCQFTSQVCTGVTGGGGLMVEGGGGSWGGAKARLLYQKKSLLLEELLLQDFQLPLLLLQLSPDILLPSGKREGEDNTVTHTALLCPPRERVRTQLPTLHCSARPERG